jgi:hypothetical protein
MAFRELGKPVEVLSMQKGFGALREYLERADALPLRDYVPAIEGTLPGDAYRSCRRGHIVRSELDDDIHYTVLALERAHEFFCFGVDPGFDLEECSDNVWNDWIGAQIRADLYGWVCPGRPALAAAYGPRSPIAPGESSHREVLGPRRPLVRPLPMSLAPPATPLLRRKYPPISRFES